MADEPASDDPSTEHGVTPLPQGAWWRRNPNVTMALGCVGLLGVIALNLYFMRRPDQQNGAPPALVSATPALPSATATALVPAPSAAASQADPAEAVDFETDTSALPTTSARPPPRAYGTVQRAAVESCTTASVAGLSRQIIAEARCLRPNAFVRLPSRPNLSLEDEVLPYLQLEARNDLVRALDARPKQKMTINSALRTLPQQFLVWVWSANRRCGVPLATPPGQSNHETGMALDIVEAAAWRSELEARSFKWLGPRDRVHFDYKAGSGVSNATDLIAFQRLWNRNHPDDKLKEDGRYSPAVEKRLKKSPPAGFPIGASCGK
jgi:hypothetical protein